jgi:aryl-phospho-beta-D-glucosidase BglC (GH1 family)
MPDAGHAEVVPPLSTCGRWIVDQSRRRVKLAGVNWYGASDIKHVVGGLDRMTLERIVGTIVELGFNSVRLPFSNAMLNVTDAVDPAAIAANPDLVGKTPLQVYDAVVEALTGAGILVILNNHTTHAMWCCNYDDDGLWFTFDYGEDRWLADWEMLADRYRANLRVVGADLRNELRPAKTNGTILPTFVNWGEGGPSDWAAAAKRAGDRILAKNPNLLVVVEGIDSADNLTGVRATPIVLSTPGKVVYQAHQYAFFPSPPGDTSHPYGDMDAAGLEAASHGKWGYIMDPMQPFTAPVLLGEFGESSQTTWLTNLESYMTKLDMDHTYWALNGGPKASGDTEPYGIFEEGWTSVRPDPRIAALRALQAPTRGPGVSAGDACPAP